MDQADFRGNEGFMAILIVTNNGLQPARMEMLWSRTEKDWLLHTPGFWVVQKQQRFRVIKRYFRIASQEFIDTHARDPAKKVRPLLNHMLEKFESEWTLGEKVTIDEIMIPFKGRFRGKQYIRSKPVKWGLRVDAIVDQQTYYLWRFRLYTGKVNVPQQLQTLGVMGYLVVHLMSGLQNKGHKLTIDRGYASPILFQYLAEIGVGANGTCNTSRKGYPKQIIKKGKGQRGEWDWLRSGNLLAVRWFDSTQNYFLSNFHYPDNEVVQRRQPGGARIDVRATSMVKQYNEDMNGIDVLDQMTRVAKDRKQTKWYMRAVIKIFEWVSHNAHILEEQNPNRPPRLHGRKRDLLEFRLEVAHQLVGDTRVTRKRKLVDANTQQRLIKCIDHFPEASDSSDTTCVVCRERHVRYKKRYPDISYKDMPCKRVKTSFTCSGCDVALCIKRTKSVDGKYTASSCWSKWHTVQEYWRPMPWEVPDL
jgi:hypothetical protein